MISNRDTILLLPESPLIVEWDNIHLDINISNFENFESKNLKYIMFLKFDYKRIFSIDEIKFMVMSFTEIISKNKNSIIILTDRTSPPIDNIRYDEFVYSYCLCRTFV